MTEIEIAEELITDFRRAPSRSKLFCCDLMKDPKQKLQSHSSELSIALVGTKFDSSQKSSIYTPIRPPPNQKKKRKYNECVISTFMLQISNGGFELHVRRVFSVLFNGSC